MSRNDNDYSEYKSTKKRKYDEAEINISPSNAKTSVKNPIGKDFHHCNHYYIPGFSVPYNYKLGEDCTKNIIPSYPWPLYISNEQTNSVDLCHKRVIDFQEHRRELIRCQEVYKGIKKKKEYKKTKKKGLYPYVIFKFAELLELKPDPYFNSKYDWYYTGGNLVTVQNDDNVENYIFHVTGSNLDNLVFSKITNEEQQIQLRSLSSKKLGSNTDYPSSEIFEIQSTNCSLPTTVDCMIRQKYAISLYSYSINDDNLVECYTIQNSEVPFISFTTDCDRRSDLVTSDLNKTVALWDCNKSTKDPTQILWKPSETNSGEKCDANWNCIKYVKRSTYAYTFLNDFMILDSRNSSNENNLINFQNFCHPCEKISALNISKCDENYLYFGTSHKVFAIDIRFCDKKSLTNNKYIVSKWTHQMVLPPLILKTYENELKDGEMLLLSSSYYEDIHLCEHKIPNINASLPYSLPNIDNALNNSQINGLCLDNSNDLRSRIHSCITGVSHLNMNRNNFILQANSIGDIFIQLLRTPLSNLEEPLIGNDNYITNQWKRYKNEIKIKTYEKPLNVTSIEELQHIKNVLLCKRLDLKNQKGIVNEFQEEPKRPKRFQKWQRSIGDLKTYKDVLAKNLLSIWDFEDNEDISFENIMKLPEYSESDTNKKDMISNWLNKSNYLTDDDVNQGETSINISLSTSKLNDTSMTLLHNDDDDETLETSKIKSSQAVRKKKRKFLMGF